MNLHDKMAVDVMVIMGAVVIMIVKVAVVIMIIKVPSPFINTLEPVKPVLIS